MTELALVILESGLLGHACIIQEPTFIWLKFSLPVQP